MADNEQPPAVVRARGGGPKLAYFLASAFGICLSGSVVLSQIDPDIPELLGMAVGILGLLTVMLASFIMGLKKWKSSPRSRMGPIALGGMFLLLIPADLWIGGKIGDERFKTHLAECTAIVEGIKSGKVPAQQSLTRVDIKPLPSTVKDIMAARQPDGSVVVLFLTGTGFPLHHIGYIFNGCGTNSNCIGVFNAFNNKVVLRKVGDGWYHFSD